MKDNQSTSQRSTQVANASNDKGDNSRRIASPSPQSGGQVPDGGRSTDVFVVEELLSILHKLTRDKPQQRWYKQLPTHPITLLLAGFVLSVLLGGFVTYLYTRKAQEVAATRSFSDELNKLRIQKVGEVWERLDQDEVKIETLVGQLVDIDDRHKSSQNDQLKQIEKVVEEDKEIIAQHRFWLGQLTYDRILHYLDATIFLLTRKILEPEAEDVESLTKARDAARIDIESERNKFLSAETAGVPNRCYLF